MLQEFTWQHFLVAASVLTLIWYFGVVLTCYRREFLKLLGHQTPKPANTFRETEPLPHRWEKGVEEMTVEVENELMGKAKLPEGMMLVGSTDFGFAGNSEQQREQQLGLVPDILQDIRALFRTLAERDSNKKDFLALFGNMKDGYPRMASHPNIGQINEFITDHAPFHLSPEELENLWD